MFYTIKVVNPNTQTCTKITITRRGDQKNVGQKINKPTHGYLPYFPGLYPLSWGQVREDKCAKVRKTVLPGLSSESSLKPIVE